MKSPYARLRYGCWAVNLSMSVVANLPPLLFSTFRSLYGLSFSSLGFLILINYLTQLGMDLLFSFFSHRFDLCKTVRSAPFFTITGLVLYLLAPAILPGREFYVLLLGTVIFSAAAGIAEALISPVIAAIPSENPQREMSRLHSVYAWGVVPVILLSALFLVVFQKEAWQWLVAFFLLVPLCAAVLLFRCPFPPMTKGERVSGVFRFMKNKRLWLCILLIFFGGAAECTMAQWASGYLEEALEIPKFWGDVLGVALFAVLLGLGRSLYAKKGKRIRPILLGGFFGAVFCYLLAAVSPFPALGLFACVLTGLFTSMLWPGNLIFSSEQFPRGGVVLFALMAAGGDLGASLVPQAVGMVTDLAAEIPAVCQWAAALSITPHQIGMKIGLILGMLFPLAGAILLLFFPSEKAPAENKS